MLRYFSLFYSFMRLIWCSRWSIVFINCSETPQPGLTLPLPLFPLLNISFQADILSMIYRKRYVITLCSIHLNEIFQIGWCLNSLSNNIRPFPPPAPGIPHLLDNIELILQTWDNKLNPFAKDHLTSLKQVLTHMFDQKV